MPTSVEQLFNTILQQEPSSPIPWGNEIPCNQKGVYIVSTLEPITLNAISELKIQSWIDRVPAMRIDGLIPIPNLIKSRLSAFLYPDETILYIGQTSKKTINERVNQFYIHTLGNPSPHSGGHWLKTLNDMSILSIYWAAVDNPEEVESSILSFFKDNVSEESRRNLYNPQCAIPFANLKHITRKIHNISNQRL